MPCPVRKWWEKRILIHIKKVILTLNIPKGTYEGVTASAHDFTNWNAFSCEGESKSSKNIPPTPRLSPEKCEDWQGTFKLFA